MFKKKGMIERKNDLIKRAEEIVNKAELEKRELTEDEAMELAEIRDDVKKIKEWLGIVDDIDDEKEMEAAPAEEERECGDKLKNREEREFEDFIRGVVMNRRDDPINLTESAGGVLIPKTVAERIIEEIYDICPILDKSSKYQTKGDLVIPYYDESSTAIEVGFARTDNTSPIP